MSKNILIFSDGTGQAGGLKPEQRLSNIYKLYKATKVCPDNTIDPREQVAFYDAGLGTDDVSSGLARFGNYVRKFLGSISGRGITENITDCYEAILNYYEPGDRIYLFGFSRGAYTVRCVASVLSLCGIPTVDGKGNDLPRFQKVTRAIADEAVRKVYEHGAGSRRNDYEDERQHLAKRFRAKYQSYINGESNAYPYFIGVFDTVAALGSKGLTRVLMVALAVLLSTFVIGFLSGVLSRLFPDINYWKVFGGFAALGGMAYLVSSLKSSFKYIRDYPNKGNFKFHFAKWRMQDYDRGLDSRVKFARHALSIDETRKSFSRVKWGFKKVDYTSEEDELEPFIQLWFAGNHSDIGGSYPENQSRLSDISLKWMIDEAKSVPFPLKINEQHLNLFPDASAMQHCEVQRVRNLYPIWWPEKFKFSWKEKPRYMASGAPYHESVWERLRLPYILKHGRKVPYRPEALKYDPNLEDLYNDVNVDNK